MDTFIDMKYVYVLVCDCSKHLQRWFIISAAFSQLIVFFEFYRAFFHYKIHLYITINKYLRKSFVKFYF